MVSTNSGSLQSSSGGDEYDSRAESISAFLNPNTFGQVSHAPPRREHAPPTPPALFDLSSLPNFFDPPEKTSEFPKLNLDAIWGKNQRSEQGFAGIGSIGSLNNPSSSYILPASVSESVAPLPPPESDTGGGHVRNPRKRSRASRRAPTTVLTTDTTNFRAMVQEFTGIPAPPFPSSPFARSRLDIFGTPSAVRSSPLDTSHFLLRPLAQKLPFIPSRPTLPPNTTPFSFQADLNLQNPKFSFQSLLQTPRSFPLSDPLPVLPDQQTHLVGFRDIQSSDVPKNDGYNHWTAGGVGSFSGDHLRNLAAGDGDKLPETSAIRTEGIVESWLCPSD